MGESHENLLKAVRHCQESLDKYTENRNDGKILHYLEKLYKLPIKVVHLEQTGVGRTVNGLRKLGGDVGDSAKGLVAKWKEMVVGEQEEDDDDDEDEEDDEDEDGYQTGEEHSSDSDRDKEIKDTSSSHRKSDNRTDDRDTVKSSKRSSSKSEGSHSSDSSKHSKKEKDRHRNHNGHSKHKSHKRKYESSSSEDETPKKRPKDENRHKSRSESEEETKSKERKHKSEKYKSEYKEKKHRESSPEVEERSSKSSKEKHREKEKHRPSGRKEESRKHEHAKKPREKDNKTKEKEKEKVREDKKIKTPKTKVINGNIANTGIDSGSGASFAEALGMCGQPSSSKSVVKKKSSSSSAAAAAASSSFVERKEKIPPAKPVEDPVPKLLKEPNLPNLEPIDINISSLLPPITPNYRPLGNLMASDVQSKKWLSESEALTNSITSKKERTKVYSGNKTIYGKVSSLFDLCIRILQDNIDALEYTGGVPYSVLKPILEKANPNQLYSMEHHNPYLIEDTDELWQLHCQKDFRNKKREELEAWREMYLRCLDERDAKLKALTANIKQAQDKSLPVRMTKLAYVDAVAKPPRNIARKQAKNGTAFDMRKPAAVTPTARLTALATSGEAGKVAVPNPGSRAVDRVGGHAAAKAKKAPLMLKSISSFKNRFKR